MISYQFRTCRAGSMPAFLLSALFFALLAAAAGAQDQAGYGDPGGGPSQPARAIRLSYVDGAVQLAQDGQPLAEQAVANVPIVQGMTLSSGDDGKAEIQFEDGSVARLSPDSSMTVTVLSGAGTAARAELSVDRGLCYFEIQGTGQSGPIRVRFGGSLISSSGFTVLRVENDTPPGAVAVMTGNAHIDKGSGGGNGLYLDLQSGESVDFAAGGPNGYSVAETIPQDSWDAWNADRDQALNQAAANQTAAPSEVAQGQAANPAWSDLDANGSWYNVPGEGYVWSPYDASNPGFDPYGNGSWVWMPRFGYVWASGYSWGYMPYSCGMWNYYDGFGWGWAPGFGGCNPWWSTGVYLGPRFGALPIWYRPVQRPIAPREPRRGRPVPMIPVRTRITVNIDRLPVRDRNTPVTIRGASVVGLRPFPGASAPQHGIVQRGNPGWTQGPVNRTGNGAPRQIYNQPSQSNGNAGGQRSGGQEPGQRQGPVTTPPTGNRGTWAPSPAPAPAPAQSAPAPTPAPSRPWSNSPRPYYPPTTTPAPSAPPAATPRNYNPPAAAPQQPLAPQPMAPQPTPPRTYNPPVVSPPSPSQPRTYNPPPSAPAPVQPRTYSPPAAAPPAPTQPRTYNPPSAPPSRPSGGSSSGGAPAPTPAPAPAGGGSGKGATTKGSEHK